MKNKKQMSETLLIGGILALVGGYLDAYTYVSRGGVFANAQTGNMILFGIKISNGEWLGALLYIVPIFCFFIGIWIALSVRALLQESKVIHWRQVIVGVECVMLAVAGLIPQEYNIIANCIVSFVCSLQFQSFRKIKGSVYASTFCTGNLRSATEQLYRYKKSHNKQELRNSLTYFCIIFIFIIGAVTGSLVTSRLGIYSVFLCCGGLIAALLIMFIE